MAIPFDSARELLLHHLYSLQKKGKHSLWLGPGSHAAIFPPRNEGHNQQQAEKAVISLGTSELQSVEGERKIQRLARLKEKAELGTAARNLGTLRSTMVFATGNPDAQLMLVGEAPGMEEEKMREPFVGPAGQKLNQILKAMGLTRADVYITNLCKFRPAIEGSKDQGSHNRPPSPEEMTACLEFVREEIAIVRPKVIVALGAIAMKGLLAIDAPLNKMRGEWHSYEGVAVRVTYHPSYLLRIENEMGQGKADKRKAWEDMLAVMEKLELPISDKQRGYFT